MFKIESTFSMSSLLTGGSLGSPSVVQVSSSAAKF